MPSQSAQPWMLSTNFPPVPEEYKHVTCGYKKGKLFIACSYDDLVKKLEQDFSKRIRLIWTQEHSHLVTPQEVPGLFEPLKKRENLHLKRFGVFPFFHIVLWGSIIFFELVKGIYISQLFIFAFVVFGIIPLLENEWERYRLRKYSPKKMAHDIVNMRFYSWIVSFHTPFTWFIVVAIVLVGLSQVIIGLSTHDVSHRSIELAGLVKQATAEKEYWRLLTSTFLHGNVIHFLFNLLALFTLAKLVEALSNRSQLAIVFLISAVAGNVLSLFLLPDKTSVGSSGAIMGLFGYLILLGIRHRHVMPLAFVHSMLVSVIFITIIGLIAYDIIDNATHLGGFLTGISMGTILIDKNDSIPLTMSKWTNYVGIAAEIIILASALFSIRIILSRFLI